MKKGGSFFWGMIIGTMTGLVMGIILSQKKEHQIKNIFGKKTENLRNNIQNISNNVRKKVQKFKSNIEENWKKSKIKNNLSKIDQVEDELGT